jgi:hypothetical protein
MAASIAALSASRARWVTSILPAFLPCFISGGVISSEVSPREAGDWILGRALPACAPWFPSWHERFLSERPLTERPASPPPVPYRPHLCRFLRQAVLSKWTFGSTLLGSEIVAQRAALRDTPLTTKSAIDLLRPVPSRFNIPIAKGIEGPVRCVCSDQDQGRAYIAKYGPKTKNSESLAT